MTTLREFFSLPMTSGERDRQVAVDELGRPVYATPMGDQYAMTEEQPQSFSDAVSQFTGQAVDDPLGTIGTVASAIAQGAWNGVEAPGNALRGETQTYGDVADTALDWGIMGAAGRAPEGSLRMFQSRNGGTIDDAVELARSGDGIFHSGHAGIAEDIHRWGVEPTNEGSWIREVAVGAVDDVDDFLAQNPPAAWWSRRPEWVRAQAARAAGVSQADVTDDMIRQYGHLAIARGDDWADEVFEIGPDGIPDGEFSRVTDLAGNEQRLYETPLYELGDDNVGRYPFGIERNELVTGAAIEPDYTLTGDELVDFLNRYNGAPETPAAQVARLLREGRASEVTDDLMAQADPQEMYRLYDEGLTGQPMPMDEASRMARAQEMGFDTGRQYYHGTNAEFSEMRPSTTGKIGPGVYMTDNPNFAGAFASDNPEMGGRVLPLTAQRYEPVPDFVRTEARAARSAERDIFDGADAYSDLIRRYGYDGVEVLDQRTVLTPSNIRSRFARFDPRLSHLANLSAGAAGAGVALPYLSDDERGDTLSALRSYMERVQ